MLYLAAAFAASFSLLGFAMKTLPMGTSYAVWTGIGATGGAILGMIFMVNPKAINECFLFSSLFARQLGYD